MTNVEEPKIPFRMKIYYHIRNILTPDYSFKYLLFESIIISSIVFSLLISLYNITQLSILLVSLVYPLIISTLLLCVEEDHYDIVNIMRYSMKKFVLLSMIIIIVTASILFILFNIPDGSILIMIFLISYISILVTRSKRYRGERQYYTNSVDSNTEHKWVRGSVMLEKADKSIKQNNLRTAFYWLKRAEKLYNNIMIEEDKPMLKEGANSYATACTFYSASLSYKGRKSIKYQQIAEKMLQKANERLQHRYCSKCRNLYHIQNIKLLSDKNNKKQSICEECWRKYNKNSNSDKHKTKKSKKRSRSNYGNRSNNSDKKQRSRRTKTQDKSTREQKYKSGHITKSKYDDISIEEAMNTLNIDKPLNEDKINKQFRKQVKKSHPDTGGSEDQFKKVKKSKEILLSEI